VTAAYRVTITNAKAEAVNVDVREAHFGSWKIIESSVPAEKLSSTESRFPRAGARGGRGDVDLHGASRAMTVQIAHIGDMHFGGLANVPVVEALERMLPDLRPDAIVIGGDLSQRARHGEFQRGRAFANLCRETAPVLVIPGNHDVQWWRRPFIPFGKDVVYEKYRGYFGADLTPTLTIPVAPSSRRRSPHTASPGAP